MVLRWPPDALRAWHEEGLGRPLKWLCGSEPPRAPHMMDSGLHDVLCVETVAPLSDPVPAVYRSAGEQSVELMQYGRASRGNGRKSRGICGSSLAASSSRPHGHKRAAGQFSVQCADRRSCGCHAWRGIGLR